MGINQEGNIKDISQMIRSEVMRRQITDEQKAFLDAYVALIRIIRDAQGSIEKIEGYKWFKDMISDSNSAGYQYFCSHLSEDEVKILLGENGWIIR